MQLVKNRFIYISISIVLILCGIGAMVFNAVQGKGAFNYDIQFTGGTSMEVAIGTEFNNDDITAIVNEVTGDPNPQVQKAGADGHNVIVKTKSLDEETRTALQEAITEKYSVERNNFSIQDVSATISKEMQQTSALAVIVACIAMLIYVTIRFKDFKTGASAVIALAHDALIVLGCYALFRIPLNNSFIAAILTVLGYSINASIIIFDRVRENKKRLGKSNFTELVDTSVTQTMKRSIFTSLTTFFTIACLYFFGVESIREFALPIAVGIICGTYSSVFVAGNVWYMLSTAGTKKA